jgi:hypothetical protein
VARGSFQLPPSQLERWQKAQAGKLATAATQTVRELGAFIKKGGRASIASAGFSRRWQNTWRVVIFPAQGISQTPAAYGYHKIRYSNVFEEGATIHGSPLLWLPLPGVPKTIGGRHMSPKNYVQTIGPLHTIFRPGKPPLLAGYMQGVREGTAITVRKLKAGNQAMRSARPGAPVGHVISVPLFFGISSVTLAKRFNVKGVFQQARQLLKPTYERYLRGA